jgi:hypothetical protein
MNMLQMNQRNQQRGGPNVRSAPASSQAGHSREGYTAYYPANVLIEDYLVGEEIDRMAEQYFPSHLLRGEPAAPALVVSFEPNPLRMREMEAERELQRPPTDVSGARTRAVPAPVDNLAVLHQHQQRAIRKKTGPSSQAVQHMLLAMLTELHALQVQHTIINDKVSKALAQDPAVRRAATMVVHLRAMADKLP